MSDTPARQRTNDRNATESNGPTENRTGRRMKDVDHTSPVDGHVRTFSRGNERRSAKPDGGRRGGTGDESAGDEAQQASDGTGRYWPRVKDVDHTSPVDGHNRTFGRNE